MRDDELQLGTRDKVVQKMTREGAVEENMSQNSERRVSARASDADFSHLTLNVTQKNYLNLPQTVTMRNVKKSSHKWQQTALILRPAHQEHSGRLSS